jgi:hypothetical protein
MLICLSGLSTSNDAYSIYDTPSFTAHWSAESWGPFVSELATRLKGKVRHYGVGNELYDLPASRYFCLLTNTWQALRSVDTGIVVHAFDQILEEGTLNLISNIYAAGAAGYVDVADYHAYHRLAEEDDLLSRLQALLHRFEDGKSFYAGVGEKYVRPTNAVVWQTEYLAPWSKVTLGNRVTEEERLAAGTLVAKMVTAKAFGVDKFVLSGTEPLSADNGLFAGPMHAPAATPCVSLLYAGAATLAEHLTQRDLHRVFVVNGVYAYGFGPPGTTDVSVVAAWATAQQTPVALAAGAPVFRLTRLDGSSFVTNGLLLTASPVFVTSPDGTAYDWSRLFGSDSFPVP